MQGRKRVAATAATAGLALALTGCVGFQGTPKGKQVSAKNVQVQFRVCERGAPNCSDGGSGTSNTDLRILVGLRVPQGSQAPDRLPHKPLSGVAVTRSPSLTRELNQKASRPGDSKWIGYLSEQFANAGGPQIARFKARLTIPRKAGRAFAWRPAVGYTDTEDPDNPGTIVTNIDCGDDVQTGDGGNAVCIDAPETRRELRRSLRIPLD